MPVHRQVRRAILEAIVNGGHQEGTRLPSIQKMSEMLNVNRLTVLKAVRALIQKNALRSVMGKGLFVAAHPDKRTLGGMNSEDGQGLFGGERFFEGIAEGPDTVVESERVERIGPFVAESLDTQMISFAVGFPPSGLLPVEAIRRRTNRLLLSDEAAAVLGYTGGAGDKGLIASIRDLLSKRGVVFGPDDHIIVTHGAQQALTLCLERYFQHVGALAIESPGYMGAVAACRQRGIPLVPVPVDQGGINPGRLAEALSRSEVRGVYTVPTFQNPTGVTQHLARRKRIVSLAEKHGALIIEDDTYADLRLGGKPVPPILSLEGGERVMYIGSFSKSIAPGLRVGFVAAKGDIGRELLHLKETVDISTGALSQAVVRDFIESGAYRRHLSSVRQEYRLRRDAMVEAISRMLGDVVRVVSPKGGLHLYVMFTHPVDIESLEKRCRSAGVLFAPGALFFSDGRRPSAVRLNFALHTAAVIEEGIRRLAECLKEEMTSCATPSL
jgi:DNA-binding transcriptional MocR family regulator